MILFIVRLKCFSWSRVPPHLTGEFPCQKMMALRQGGYFLAFCDKALMQRIEKRKREQGTKTAHIPDQK
jgi:hypothetical protein